ncbi:MAG: MerR family transcriptional regulator [Verrucomicrobia bacterium]|nr:MerR family transcriptional regulator [Verrucomicrobiota bacterium]
MKSQPVKNISYRVLNHWDEEGLLECVRDSEKGWRKFNLIEGFWVHAIEALRKMGLSFQSLGKVKRCIFHEITTQTPHFVYVALPSQAHKPAISHPSMRYFWYS